MLKLAIVADITKALLWGKCKLLRSSFEKVMEGSASAMGAESFYTSFPTRPFASQGCLFLG